MTRRSRLAVAGASLVASPFVFLYLREPLGAPWAWGLAALLGFGGLGFLLWSWIRAQGASTPTWSFHPLSAMVLVATDSVALVGDAATLASGGVAWILVVLMALGVAFVVWVTELAESRRFVRATVKAFVAFVLVIIPTPVAGILGATTSIGHRLVRKTPVVDP